MSGISLLQSRMVNAGDVGSATYAYNSSVTSGSLLVLGMQSISLGATFSVSDPVNGVWHQDILSQQGSVWQAAIFSVPNSLSGIINVTVTQSIPNSLYFNLEEFSGIISSSPLDQTSSHSATSATPDSGSTGAIAQVPELVVGVLATTNGTITAGTGYTLDQAINTLGMEYLVVNSGLTAQNATFNLNSSTSYIYLALCATYRGQTQSGPLPRQVYVMP